MQILSEDFKYIMQDTMKVYVGASYSYDELIHEEHTPFKLKAIAMQYMRKEVDENKTLAQHITELKENSLSYMAFHQLKVKVKVTFVGLKTDRKGNPENECKILPLDTFLAFLRAQKEQDSFFVEEIVISKLSLMGFSI